MISIILPTYNRGHIILKSIESLLLQTFKDFEIIIVDDCSTDNTKEEIKKIIDSRVRYIKLKKNYGANKARNIGINNAKYDIIAFQDSDDYWHKDKLIEQIKYFKKNDYDLIGCCYRYIKNKRVKKIYPLNKISENENFNRMLLKENFISTQTILGKKSVFLKEKFDENLSRFQDWELLIRISKQYKIGFLNKVLVDVNFQKISISNNNKNGLESLKYILNKNKKEILKDYKIASSFYLKIYIFSIKSNNIEKIYAKKAYTLHKSIKNLIFYMISLLNLEIFCMYLYKKLNK